MKIFTIYPTKAEPENGIFPQVNSYISRAISLGKALYGKDFIIGEAKEDIWGERVQTWRKYDCNGILIADKNGWKGK